MHLITSQVFGHVQNFICRGLCPKRPLKSWEATSDLILHTKKLTLQKVGSTDKISGKCLKTSNISNTYIRIYWKKETSQYIFSELPELERFFSWSSRIFKVSPISPCRFRFSCHWSLQSIACIQRQRCGVEASKLSRSDKVQRNLLWHLRLWWIVGAYSFAAQANMEPNRNLWQLSLYSRNDCVKLYDVVECSDIIRTLTLDFRRIKTWWDVPLKPFGLHSTSPTHWLQDLPRFSLSGLWKITCHSEFCMGISINRCQSIQMIHRYHVRFHHAEENHCVLDGCFLAVFLMDLYRTPTSPSSNRWISQVLRSHLTRQGIDTRRLSHLGGKRGIRHAWTH